MFIKAIEDFNDDRKIDIKDNDEIKDYCLKILGIILFLCLSPIIISVLIITLIGFIIEVSVKRYFIKNHLKRLINNSLKNHLKKLSKNTYYLSGYATKVDFVNTNTSLYEFIKNFLVSYKDNYNANYNTYENNTNKFICGINRRRSLGDIYLICKHYYPKCTINEVLENLVKLNSDGYINTQYCTTIHKQVFFSSCISIHNDKDCKLDYCDLTFDIITNYYLEKLKTKKKMKITAKTNLKEDFKPITVTVEIVIGSKAELKEIMNIARSIENQELQDICYNNDNDYTTLPLEIITEIAKQL